MIAAQNVPITGGRNFTELTEVRRGGWPFAFIRGAMDAEASDGHRAHADTEYRYDMFENPGLPPRVGVLVRDGRGEWRQGWHGKLADFVYEFGAPLGAPVIVQAAIPRDRGAFRYELATLKHAIVIEEMARDAVDRFDGTNPNRAIYRDISDAWADGIAAVRDRRALAMA
ncbi:hypothetical protein [Sediminimonas sp.]|uniref:hypothetical protein n=1 Tax=Sediminimonas sp. TaxID=2823379 RepID=UPI0025F52917|nr:hypothetical protein [Sediminimonas sp.]